MAKFDTKSSFEGRKLAKKQDWSGDTESVSRSIRFHRERLEALKDAFHDLGLDFGTGVRMVLYDWLKRQG